MTLLAAARLPLSFGRGGQMLFPDAEHAVVAEGKVRNCLLNPDFPVGGSKPKWLASLDYAIDSWQDWVNDFRRLAETAEAGLPWMMATLAEHSLVVLNADVPDSGLHAGYVGAIVHVHRQGTAYEVEFVDGTRPCLSGHLNSCERLPVPHPSVHSR